MKNPEVSNCIRFQGTALPEAADNSPGIARGMPLQSRSSPLPNPLTGISPGYFMEDFAAFRETVYEIKSKIKSKTVFIIIQESVPEYFTKYFLEFFLGYFTDFAYICTTGTKRNGTTKNLYA